MAFVSKSLVCLVAPGHLTSTPRLLKEASSLRAEGYRIHTVSLDHFAPNRAMDDTIVAEAGWSATRVAPSNGILGIARKVTRQIASRMPARCVGTWHRLAARARQAEVGQLTRAARAVAADYYIGHCFGALPAVAAAAHSHRVRFGFDLEDFHEAETHEVERNPNAAAAIRTLLRRHLPAAAHLTAASPLIAEAYRRHFNVHPAVVLNVFPLDEGPAEPVNPGPISPHRPAILYWVSQTIGPGRGLEEIIEVLAHVRTPTELHLRGHAAPGYASALSALANRVGCKSPIRFLPFSPSREVVRLAAVADLGLSTERSTPLNRDLCLTNKVFIYPLAGVPQLLSTTQAQSALAAELGAAALSFSLTEPVGTARLIDGYFASDPAILHARRHAWSLGRDRFNWEREQANFIRAFHSGSQSDARTSGRSARFKSWPP